MTQRYKIPKSCQSYHLVVKLGLYFFDKNFKVLRDVLDGTPMKKYKVKNFSAFLHIFFPLRCFAKQSWRLGCNGDRSWISIRLGLICLL